MVQVIDTSDFESKVLNADTPVLVDFFATWCGPCKTLAPVLEDVARELTGRIKVYKVDVDNSPDLADQYQIINVPTLIVFEHGHIKRTMVGEQPKQAILSLILG